MNLNEAKELTISELKDKISKEQWFTELPEEYKPSKIKFFERMINLSSPKHLEFLRSRFELNKIVID